MLAQSLVEYGAIGAVVAGIQHYAYSVRTWLADRTTTTWVLLGAIALVWMIVRRRRT